MLSVLIFLPLIAVCGSKIDESGEIIKKSFFKEELIYNISFANIFGARDYEARYGVEPKFKTDLMDMDLLRKCTEFTLQSSNDNIENKSLIIESNNKKNNLAAEKISINMTEITLKMAKEILKKLKSIVTLNDSKLTESSPSAKNTKKIVKAKGSKAKSKSKSKTDNKNNTESEENIPNIDELKADKAKLSKTLNHPHCIQAIKSCLSISFDCKLITELVIQFPEVMKNHLEIIFDLKDFSFLTPNIALELFSGRNFLLNPFAIEALVKSVTVEVLVSLLDLWDYDLTLKDAKLVIDVWGEKEEFLKIIEEDPRSWLLWLKLSIPKDFPIVALVNVPNMSENIFKYVNLFLAVIYDIELNVFDSLYNLQTIFTNINNKMWINNATSEGSYNLSSDATIQAQIWDLWFKEGQDEIIKIIQQFDLKKQLITVLTNSVSILENTNDLLQNILLFLKVPLNSLSRFAYSKSHDQEKLLKAQSNVKVFSFHLAPETEFWNWSDDKFDFWALMWNKLEFVSGIKTYYDPILSNQDETSTNSGKLIINLMEVYKFVKFKHERMISWPTFLTLVLIIPTKKFVQSNFYINALEFYGIKQSHEFEEQNLDYIKSILASESVEKYMKFIEFYDPESEKFKLAPETLSRDQIKALIKTPEIRKFMMTNLFQIMKLQTLIDFNADDLLEFFPAFDSEFHLELHDALHTANPEALIGYLRGVEGTLNFPENFAWSVHPVAWNYSEFVDLMADNIPFSSFAYYRKDVESLNLAFVVCDIMGRISRCNGNSLQIQKQIIKWAINMEWIFNHYHANSNHQEFHGYTAQIYKTFIEFESKSRKELVEFLKVSSCFKPCVSSQLLMIIESVPLSYIRLSTCYANFLLEAQNRIRTQNHVTFFNVLFNQFSAFQGKKYSDVRIMELEKRTSENVDICRNFIQKYFNPIEKITWENRLDISTLISIKRFIPHSNVPMSIFTEPQSPAINFLLTLKILKILNFENQELNQEFIQYSPESLNIVNSKIERYDEVITNARKDLLENDLALRRLLLSNEKKDNSKK